MKILPFPGRTLQPLLSSTSSFAPPRPLPHTYFSNGEDNVIDVERRRPGDGSTAGERERAEAPHRDRSGGSSGSTFENPPTGGGGGSSGGGGGSFNLPSLPSGSGGSGGSGGLPSLPIMAVVLVLIVCVGIFYFLQSPSTPTTDNSTNNSNLGQPTAVALATSTPYNGPTFTPRPTRVPGSTQGQTWTVMLYQDADDKELEEDIDFDLNEAERVGSSDQVQIVSQIDRYSSGFNGDGNVTGARRYYVTKDNDLSALHSQMVGNLGTVDMSDPNTLVDFATWAIKTYPADNYVLILSDHGMGWPGGMTATRSDGRSLPNAPLADDVGNLMYLSDINSALGKIRANTNIDKFEMVGLDACLMGGLEVLDTLSAHARYAVVSEETEPSLGYAYAGFLGSLEQNPSMTGGDLAKAVVQSYITGDQRIVDDQARAQLVKAGSVTGGLFNSAPSASQVAQELSSDITITAADLGAVPQLMSAVNDMSYDFQQVDQNSLAKAREYARSFTNVFGDSTKSSYIDLGSFVQLLQSYKPQGDIATALNNVNSAIGKVVIGEKHGPDENGATGVSIYFPTSQLYGSPSTGAQSYTAIANQFATDSVWDNFLAFHYTGRKFDKAPSVVAVPQSGETITSPAAGVTVSPLRASGNTVSIGGSLNLSADITGKNVGYVKFFTGYLDTNANSIDVVDTDYLQSKNTRQLNGLYYPDWGTGSKFTIQFKWEPIVFGISDGTTTVQALLNPDTYGASSQDAIYTVDGNYTFASGEQRYARMFFKNGTLQNVFGFTGQDGTGATSQITPQKGDKFTVYERWMDLDASGNVQQTVNQPGDTLTFGDQTFKWKELDAAAGQYVVGFIVEDLDGNQYPTYTNVTVR